MNTLRQQCVCLLPRRSATDCLNYVSLLSAVLVCELQIPFIFPYLPPSIASTRQSSNHSLRYASHHHICPGALAGTLMDYCTQERVLNFYFEAAFLF